MYVTTCKINNSYATYTVLDYEENNHSVRYKEKRKPLEWKRGSRVIHPFHGKGIINSISERLVLVRFYASKSGAGVGMF